MTKKKQSTKNKNDGMNAWNKALIVGSLALGVISSIILVWTASINYDSLLLQKSLYAEKLVVEIHSDNEAIGVENRLFVPESRIFHDSKTVQIPVSIQINNYGLVPVQVYDMNYEMDCGTIDKGKFREKNFVIKPGETYSLRDTTVSPLANINHDAESCVLVVHVIAGKNSYAKNLFIAEIKGYWKASNQTRYRSYIDIPLSPQRE